MKQQFQEINLTAVMALFDICKKEHVLKCFENEVFLELTQANDKKNYEAANPIDIS